MIIIILAMEVQDARRINFVRALGMPILMQDHIESQWMFQRDVPNFLLHPPLRKKKKRMEQDNVCAHAVEIAAPRIPRGGIMPEIPKINMKSRRK